TIRPMADHAFLSGKPERSVAILNRVPHNVGIDSIEAGHSGPDAAIVTRDPTACADRKNTCHIMSMTCNFVIHQPICGSPVSRKLPLGQSAQPVFGSDPYSTVRRREDFENALAGQTIGDAVLLETGSVIAE